MTVTEQSHTGVITQAEMAALSGVAFFKAVRDGHLPHPPLTALIPMQVIEIEAGRMAWATRPPARFVNPMGQVHGGYAMTVLDSALGCAVHSALPAGRGYTTIEAKVNMTRPIPQEGAVLRAEGWLITLGGRVATSEAKLTDARGRVLAFGTSTCLVFDI